MENEKVKVVVNHKKQGKKNRAKGKAFEIKTRQDLENSGWIMSKWANNVEFSENNPNGKLVAAKSQFNPFFKRIIGEGSGLPDFIGIRRMPVNYDVIGVECKVGKYLSAEEKKKCTWYLDNKIFSKILIAYEGPKEGRKNTILYKEFVPEEEEKNLDA